MRFRTPRCEVCGREPRWATSSEGHALKSQQPRSEEINLCGHHFEGGPNDGLYNGDRPEISHVTSYGRACYWPMLKSASTSKQASPFLRRNPE